MKGRAGDQPDADRATPLVPASTRPAALTFLIGGFVKGVVGLGLPTITLSILTATIGLKQAIVLILVPTIVTNIWQAIVGPALGGIVHRLWPLLVASCLGTWLGAGLLARADALLFETLLGLLMCAYAGIGLFGWPVRVPRSAQRWLSPLIGVGGGFVARLTGSFNIGVIYLQALSLGRQELVQAMGLAFVLVTGTLALSLSDHKLVSANLALISTLALVPTALGLWLGRQVLDQLNEASFRKIFLSTMLLIGGCLAVRPLR
jgi:uncharacterized protein